MNILLTGGAGYIGSHTAHELRRNRHTVTIYDDLSTGTRSFVDEFRFIEADESRHLLLTDALRSIDLVIHLAASAYVGESVLRPRPYYDNNVVNGLALLNAVTDAGIRHFVFASSCAVYGAPSTEFVGEASVCQPVNPYGESKLFFERALASYGKAYGLQSVRLRYFNAGGADASGEIGEIHHPETHLIPLALSVVRGKRPWLDIYGDDYPTADGTCVRDYIHVSDIARVNARAVDYLLDGGAGITLNVGSGVGHSVRDILEEIKRVTKHSVEVRTKQRRPGDPARLVADINTASRVLGYVPKEDLNKIVYTAWKWMQTKRFDNLGGL